MIKTESPWLQRNDLDARYARYAGTQGTQQSNLIQLDYCRFRCMGDILLVSELQANLRCLVKTDPSHTRGPRWIPESVHIIIVAFLKNATIGYSLESLCVCVCPCLCVCVCFCTITQKEIDLGTRNRNTL